MQIDPDIAADVDIEYQRLAQEVLLPAAEPDAEYAQEVLRAADAYTQYVVNRLANPYKAPEMFGHPSDFNVWPWSREQWDPDVMDMRVNIVRSIALQTLALEALRDGSNDG